MSRDRLELVVRFVRDRQDFAQMHLRWIGFKGEALTSFAKDLPTKPLQRMRERGEALILRGNPRVLCSDSEARRARHVPEHGRPPL